MPYQHIEQIGDRSEERFALGLGARNVVGMVVAAFPILLLSNGWSLLIRAPLVILAILAGLLLTIQIQGLPCYAWPLWWARGRIRMLAQGRQISPDLLPGVAYRQIGTPLRVSGPIRPARTANPTNRVYQKRSKMGS